VTERTAVSDPQPEHAETETEGRETHSQHQVAGAQEDRSRAESEDGQHQDE